MGRPAQLQECREEEGWGLRMEGWGRGGTRVPEEGPGCGGWQSLLENQL